MLFVLAACSLNVDYTGTYYQCNPDGSCPPGYDCVDMVCLPSDPVPPACSKAIAAGGGHSCAVRNDGTVWCWGRNDFGQLGDGSAADSDLPVQVVTLTKVAAVEAGDLHTCALDEMGQVWCWGSNGSGQLGDGTTSDSRTPVQVRDLSGVTQLSVGTEHACALKGDGSVACWGDNENGQLGDGSMTARPAPTPLGLTGVKAISAGKDLSCAVLGDGSAQCWGENNDGELGVGDVNAHAQPTAVAGVTGVKAIAAGTDFTCFMTTEGFVFCSGVNDDGQLGSGTFTSSNRPVLTQIPVRAVSIDAGSVNACARDEIDNTWCWGVGGDGRNLDDSYSSRPLPVRGLVENVEQVSVGGEHTCVLDQAGAIRCAGFNRRGQLGDGRRITAGAPIQIEGVTNAVAIAAGARHTCAAQADGAVLCWGENDDGEAGNGSYVYSQTVPHVVYGIAKPKDMVAGAEHTCVLLEEGGTFCWGNNGGGRLGDGSQISSALPRSVGLGTVPSKLSIGDNSSFALVGANARAWGDMFGTTPSTITNVTDISAGSAHVCTLETDKTVLCYGENFRGQLGDGTTNSKTAPGVPVMNVANAVEVKTRGEQSCARIGDGTVKCWGLNDSGRLGLGPNMPYAVLTPSAVMGLNSVMKLAMGFDASCALKTDGTVWCWGLNYYGQVGDNSYTTRPGPVQLVGLSGAKDI
ncbi:MAG TPA: hypothetical protein VIV40_21860, partial [Kofleriaceae bacterium]